MSWVNVVAEPIRSESIFRQRNSPQLRQIMNINNMAITVIVMVELNQYVSATGEQFVCGLSTSRLMASARVAARW